MRDKIRRFFKNRIFLVVLIVLAIVLANIALRLYFERVDREARAVFYNADVEFVTKNNEINESGFYVANLKEELSSFIEDAKISTIKYRFDGEEFYFDIAINRVDDGEVSFEITEIADPEFDIRAMMHMKDVESVEYRTGNPKKASVLKINQKYNVDYFAMTSDNYYFLGNDIESLSFKDDRFYYMTYNPDYKTLQEYDSCSKEAKSAIDGFNMKHYYYKYGKINFLGDFYQKLASKTYTVQQKCDEMAAEKTE